MGKGGTGEETVSYPILKGGPDVCRSFNNHCCIWSAAAAVFCRGCQKSHHGEIESGREPRIYEWLFLVVDLEPRLRSYIL